jgi:hypothetical protein
MKRKMGIWRENARELLSNWKMLGLRQAGPTHNNPPKHRQ